MPEKVKEFKSKIREADAILIATPEYNYSVPGVLKNAIDFASRPYGDNLFNDKPVAIIRCNRWNAWRSKSTVPFAPDVHIPQYVSN